MLQVQNGLCEAPGMVRLLPSSVGIFRIAVAPVIGMNISLWMKERKKGITLIDNTQYYLMNHALVLCILGIRYSNLQWSYFPLLKMFHANDYLVLGILYMM